LEETSRSISRALAADRNIPDGRLKNTGGGGGIKKRGKKGGKKHLKS